MTILLGASGAVAPASSVVIARASHRFVRPF
jgi:hypothetical protein